MTLTHSTMWIVQRSLSPRPLTVAPRILAQSPSTPYNDGKGADDNVSVSIVATSGTTTIDTKTLDAGATSASFVLTDGVYTITANATDQA